MIDTRSEDDDRAAAPAYATCLAIGGITFRIVSADPRLAASHDYDALHAFVADPAPARADVDVRAMWCGAPPAARGDLVFDSGGSWRLLRAGNRLVFTFRSSAGGPAPYKVATFDAAFETGEVQIHRGAFASDAAVYPLQYPLDELVMIHRLSRGQGIEIHGCALVDRRRRAFVFPGQSGAGKSTLARLWSGRTDVTLLSDERVVLRTDGDRPMVHGTPWHGDALLASPATGELAGLFFLKHHPTHSIVPLSRSVAAAKLLSCAFLPFHDADGVANTVAAAERVAAAVPCHELWFAPERSVVDVLSAHMG